MAEIKDPHRILSHCTCSVPVIGSRHQYPLGSPALPMILFYETTTTTQYS